MKDIFFFEAFEEEQEQLKRFMPDNINAGFTEKTIQEYGKNNPPAEIISVRTQSAIPVEWSKSLSGILTRSTGYDHIHKYWSKCRIKVNAGYLPLYCNRAVAEQALTLWMTLLRKLPQQTEQFLSFKRDGLTGAEAESKRLLVVGVGNIGYEIVKIARGLGMKVNGVDIVLRHSDVNYVSIDTGIKEADIVVCAMNLTNENRGYFSYDLLKKSKKGAVFINIARGELSPPEALLRLITEKHLGGIGIDVYDHESELAVSLRTGNKSSDEKVDAYLKLVKLPNVIMTPHNAFNTNESVIRKSEQSIQQIVHYFDKRDFLWKVPDIE